MSAETEEFDFKKLSTPRQVLVVVCRGVATLAVGGFFGLVVWLAANHFELPAILTAALTFGGGLIGATVGWRWWDRVIDALIVGL